MTVLDSTRPRLEAIAARAQASGRLPSLAAGVVRDGELVWSTGRGRTVRAGDRERPDLDTQYRVGSITKTFTAALVLQLRDAGALDLNDRVDAHVPEGPFADATLRDLLAHRAGVPAEPVGPWWERSRGGSYEDLASANADAGAVLPVAERYHYSNTSYAVLARVAEKHHGMPWADALQERLLTPLAMARTTYHPVGPYAQGYSVEALTGTLTAEPHQDTGAMAPAGQLWSTVADLAVWGSVLLGARPDVLSEPAVRAMATPHSANPDERLGGAYGLGVQLNRVGERMMLGHSGSLPGFLAGLFVDPVTETGGIVLANGGYGLDVAAVPRTLVDTVLEHEPPLPDEWEPTPSVPERFRELLGSWHWGNQPFRMSTDGTELRLDADSGGNGLRFEPTGPDTYRGLSGYQTGETLRVVRRPDGSVSHLDIGTFCYTRIPYDPTVDYPGRGDEPSLP